MAESEVKKSSSSSSLWPALKRKLVEAKTRRKAKKQQNPFSSQGLEKFALLMAELQAKKESLVDKTGNSVSAVRYLSRSAQEWTATTLARTASRRREKLDLSPRAAEVLLLSGGASLPSSGVEIETVELSQSFSFPDPGHGEEAAMRDPIPEEEKQEEAGCSGKTRLIRSGRLFLLEKAWSRSPNSALALLVALAACVGGRLMKLGRLLTITLEVRWQKGKLWADFLQLAVVRHVLPHLTIRVPRGLAWKISPEPEADRQTSVAEAQSEIEPTFIFPVVPENSSADFPTLPTLEASDSSSSSSSVRTTRRFVKKLLSKLKAKTGSRGSKFPFSRRDKEKEMSDDGWPDEDEIFKKRGILKKCSFKKPEPSITIRRSPLGRNFSMESNTDSLHDPSVFDAGQSNFGLWMIVGLLVALVFLLVSRFSAVVAMSSLFLVLSYATKESSPRRDVESARKLLRKPGYGGPSGH